ncbi:MAG: carboxypeptidase-like regulatory domain-containing protein [Candidatus Eisenbacteria bacterium]
MRGTVLEVDSGRAIAGALVSLPDLARFALTDGEGRFSLPDVPPGPQHLVAQSIGYATHRLHAIVPRGGWLEINLDLKPEPIPLAPVTVRAPLAHPMIDGAVDGSRSAPIAAIENHPLLNDRDVFQALASGEARLEPETATGFEIRGAASDQTAYLLDGIPILSPYHAGGMSSAWNPDALASIRLREDGAGLDSAPTLGGVIEGSTRELAPRAGARGAASTTHARVTGILPSRSDGASVLLSSRWGLPDLMRGRREATYLRGQTGDRLLTLDAPLGGGRLHLLGYGSENELRTIAGVPALGGSSRGFPRNHFEWESSSLGGEWSRAREGRTRSLRAWSVLGQAGASWIGADGDVLLGTERRDLGLLASETRGGARDRTRIELRAELSRTSYRTHAVHDSTPPLLLRGRGHAISGYLDRATFLSTRVSAELGARVTSTARSTRLAPRAALRWSAPDSLELGFVVQRTQQYAQSLRNAESVVGSVFPVDLFVGAEENGVPVAESDRAALTAAWTPIAGVRLGGQIYENRSRGLLVVATQTGGPFATDAFEIGRSHASGAALDLSFTGARWVALANYGVQRLRVRTASGSYTPTAAARHRFEAGITAFPTATSSIRLGLISLLGRRATEIPNAFEWEACNITDGGCEFAGSPDYGTSSLGGRRLPAYLRVDLGVRKHWHLSSERHEVRIEAFATVTNLLGRHNTLTYAYSVDKGRIAPIEMRPRAPLVAGIEWRY